MTEASLDPSLVTDRVALLDRYFDLERVLRRDVTDSAIVSYYKHSALGYTLFHSDQGSIHMALSVDGTFSPDGYGRAPRLVWEKLHEARAKSILELGSGNGFNLELIAGRELASEFVGVDLTPVHVRRAKARLRELPNATVVVGDFTKLDFPPQTFDFVFSIESFCHALDPEAALRSARRVCAPGSQFVVIDAWRTDKTRDSSETLTQALSVTERSMAVANTQVQRRWLALASLNGWELDSIVPLSHEVLPNLQRFERLAERFLARPRLAHVVGRRLRLRMLENVIAGYLMAETVRQGLHTYDMVTLRAK